MSTGIGEWLKSDFTGSAIALWVGWFCLITGIGQSAQNPPPSGDDAFLGIVMLLGTYACRSAKKRKLGLKKNGAVRKAVEIGLLLLMMALVLCRQDAVNRMIDHALSGIVAPVWVLVAYVVVSRKKTAEGLGEAERML
jgi:hypothetical protein